MKKPYYKNDNITLYHGDSIKLLKLMPNESVDIIFADPPYHLSNGGMTVKNGKMVSVNKAGWDKSKGQDLDRQFHERWITEALRLLKPNGTLWISGTYHSIYHCGEIILQKGNRILNEITWFKPNATPNMGCRCFTASHETLLWISKDKNARHTFNYQEMKDGYWPDDKLKNPGKQMRSVWAISPPGAKEKKQGKHPTQKPIKLLSRIIQATSSEGDLILDPFNGSGTTGVAAMLNNRKYIGIDLDKEYLDLSIRRFRDILDVNREK